MYFNCLFAPDTFSFLMFFFSVFVYSLPFFFQTNFQTSICFRQCQQNVLITLTCLSQESRKEPYSEKSSFAIIYQVREKGLRPPVPCDEATDALVLAYRHLYSQCWTAEVSHRPNLHGIQQVLTDILTSRSDSDVNRTLCIDEDTGVRFRSVTNDRKKTNNRNT